MKHRNPQSILIIVSFDSVGGVERNAAMLTRALRRSGFRVDLMTLVPGRGLLSELRPHVLPGWDSPQRVRRLRQLWALRSILRSGEFGTVVTFGPVPNLLNCLSGQRRSVLHVIAEVGNPWISRRTTWNRTFMWTYRFADILILQTERSASTFRKIRRRPSRIEVIPNGLDSNVDITPPDSPREKTIIGASRLVPMKRYGDLISAFARLGNERDGWSLVIAGSGHDRENLVQLCEKLGVTDSVSLPGRIDEPWHRIARASIFALCSEHEGSPTVLIEAMAAGCPIISSDCDYGPRDLLEHGRSGLLYPVGDVDTLSQCLARLIKDPTLRVRLATQAQMDLGQYLEPVILERWKHVLDPNRIDPSPNS